MTVDRIGGGIAVLFGVFLLLYGIPANVRMIDGAMPYPALFPQIAAWMFIGLGLVQMVFVKTKADFPQRHSIFRLSWRDSPNVDRRSVCRKAGVFAGNGRVDGGNRIVGPRTPPAMGCGDDYRFPCRHLVVV